MKEMKGEKSLDAQLWHACAGGMVQMPLVNSKVFYFPQGHAEHTLTNVDFGGLIRIPPLFLCRVLDVEFLAEQESDEVYAKVKLIPVRKNECYDLDEIGGGNYGFGIESGEKPVSFAKTLTQSDANNGGGFSVPRYCAETIFSPLDYTADPPVQTVIAMDVHGEIWKFRHIYRGTPRRHLLTTGWSTFVNQKKLVAGDSIVFLRANNGDLRVGIRRAKRSNLNPPESGWNTCYPTFSMFDIKKKVGKVRVESVIEAVTLATNGQPFEVLYYPRASTPEFFVKASLVNASMRIQWCDGMRFKMPFETEDSSRISWFMGTVASVQVNDPIHWPNSPWRVLQVIWDEPDLLQNVKCVNPWLVELVTNIPTIHIPPYSGKKLCLSHQSEICIPSFLGNNPLGPSSYHYSAGIQGARHALFGVPLQTINKLHVGPTFHPLDPYPKIPDNTISCSLTIGNSNQNSGKSEKKSENVKTPQFVLFGQPILTEQQMYHHSCSLKRKSSSFNPDRLSLQDEFGYCKVFVESEDISRTLDLSMIGSYEELYKTLSDMFGIEISDLLSNVRYTKGYALKHIGDEPFSDFVKTVKRLTILMNSGNGNVGRKWITGLPSGERGLGSSNQTGQLSIFA